MVNIQVHRYTYPQEYQGWMEPDDRQWIAFIRADGVPEFYLDRDPETGAIRDPSSRAFAEQALPGETVGTPGCEIVEPPYPA